MNSILLIGGAAVLVLWLAGRRAAKSLDPTSSSESPEFGAFGGGGVGGGVGAGGGGPVISPYPAMNFESRSITAMEPKSILERSSVPLSVGMAFVENIGAKKKSDLTDAPLLTRSTANITQSSAATPRTAKIEAGTGTTAGGLSISTSTATPSTFSGDSSRAKSLVAAASAAPTRIALPGELAITPRAISLPQARVAPPAASVEATQYRVRVAATQTPVKIATPVRAAASVPMARVSAPDLLVGSYLRSIGR